MSIFDKYGKTDDSGCFISSSGEWNEDKAMFVHCEFLDFCSCGAPEISDLYILKTLRSISNGSHCNVDRTGSDYFTYYVLDKMGITEHGGSVPGWLTDKGKDLLSMLEEIEPELIEASE